MTDSQVPKNAPYTVTSSMDGQVGIIALAGSVGMDDEERILSAYRTVTTSGARLIRLLFMPGTTINSSGIALLITMTSQAKKSRQKVEVAGLSPHYRKIFDMIGLTQYVKIVEKE